MASTQTSFDSMLRSFDENQARHDEHKRSFEKNERSFEELKDMMRTLLVMEGMHSPSEEHQDRVDPAPSTNWILNGANREEQRKRLEDHHSCLEENRVCMEPMQKITEHRFEFSIDNTENFQKITEQRFESLTSMVRNLSRERDQDPPATDRDSHPVETGVNSVQGNVSANVNLPNRRPNLVREAPGSSSMEWNRESSDRSSAGGTELRGDVWAQGILMQNQTLEWKDSIEGAIPVHSEVKSATRTFILGIDFASRAQAQNWEILGYLPAERCQELDLHHADSLQKKQSSTQASANLGDHSEIHNDDRGIIGILPDELNPELNDRIYVMGSKYHDAVWALKLSSLESICGASSKVNPNCLAQFIEFIVEVARKQIVVCDVTLADWTSGHRTTTVGVWIPHNAQEVFVEMPSRIVMLTALVDEKITNENGMAFLALKMPYDRGKCKLLSGDEDGSKFSFRNELVIVLGDVILALFASGLILFGAGTVIFDPGEVAYIVQWSQHSAALDTIGDYTDSVLNWSLYSLFASIVSHSVGNKGGAGQYPTS